jgi:hypothetical protein
MLFFISYHSTQIHIYAYYSRKIKQGWYYLNFLEGKIIKEIAFFIHRLRKKNKQVQIKLPHFYTYKS